MTILIKGYLLIVGIASMVMGFWAMFGPDFVAWYPAFDGVERGTPLANFIRTMSGVFVASGYILVRFIFVCLVWRHSSLRSECQATPGPEV